MKATLHWVSANHAVRARVRLYGPLFTEPEPGGGEDLSQYLNEESLTVLEDCRLEPALAEAEPGETVQFERLGYFCPDRDSTPEEPVFNRTVALRDTWAREKAKEQAKQGGKG